MKKHHRRVCNRLSGSSRCQKIRKRGDCSGTDEYCPSRDGMRANTDFVVSVRHPATESLGRMDL